MDQQALIRRLMAIFIGELEEHVRTLERELLSLERTPDPATAADTYKMLFRTAHSLKGAARSVNVEPIERAAHCLESIFSDARDGVVDLGPQLFELLFAAVDAARDAATRLAAGQDLGTSRLAELLPRLEQPHGQAAPRSLPPSPTAERANGPAADQATPAASPGDGMVRMSAARLDRLVARGSELHVARRRAAGRSAAVATALETARRLDREWHAAQATARVAGAPQNEDSSATGTLASEVSRRHLVNAKEHLQALTRQLDDLAVGLTADSQALDKAAAPLEDELLRARMEPFARACEGFDRLMRDLTQAAGKQAELVIAGGDIEIDRSVLAVIRDPLIHLVRNAVDHGIEAPADRLAAGKPERGRITMSAALRSGQIEIHVADDGRGLNIEAIRERARTLDMPVPDHDADVARLVFASGFSTSAKLTEVSGRGVGLDIVKTAVEQNRGTVEIATEAGAGMRITLKLPPSLTRFSALLVSVGDQVYAFDGTAIAALQRAEPAALKTVGGRDFLVLGDGPIPAVLLSEVVGRPGRARPADETQRKIPLVVLRVGAERAAFVVDELLADQEIVIQDLGARLRGVRFVTGGTTLPTGRIALILNTAELLRVALGHTPELTIAGRLSASETSKAPKRLLVVDDSVTTRTLIKSVLDAAGYIVTTAVDGQEAWQILQENGADLLVSDVEMPRMDGFTLTETIRASQRLRNLPVVLMTALASEQDRRRGLDAGADAYLVKSAFDQSELLETVGQLL